MHPSGLRCSHTLKPASNIAATLVGGVREIVSGPETGSGQTMNRGRIQCL